MAYSEGECPDHEACWAWDSLASSQSTFSSQLKCHFLGEISLGDSKGLGEERLPFGQITQHPVLMLQHLLCHVVNLFNVCLLLWAITSTGTVTLPTLLSALVHVPSTWGLNETLLNEWSWLEFSFLKACISFSVGVVLWDCGLPSWIQAVISKFDLKKQHSVCLSVCIYHLYTYLSVYLSVYLPTCVSIYPFMYLSLIYLCLYHLLKNLSIEIGDKCLKPKEGQQACHISHSLLPLHSWCTHPQIPTSPPWLASSSLAHDFLQGHQREAEYVGCLDTQGGCERWGGSIFHLSIGKISQGLGEARLRSSQLFSLWLPLGRIWGGSLSFQTSVTRWAPAFFLKDCFSVIRKCTLLSVWASCPLYCLGGRSQQPRLHSALFALLKTGKLIWFLLQMSFPFLLEDIQKQTSLQTGWQETVSLKARFLTCF